MLVGIIFLPIILLSLLRMILVYKVSEVGSSVPSAKRANDVEGSADNSFDRRTRKRVDPSVILLSHVLPTDPDRIGSFVAYKTLIFLGMLVLLKKLEDDSPAYTRVDDDGVEFSPEGGDYFPTMGDETKKDKCLIFLLLLIICLVLMLMKRVSYLRSIQKRSGIKFMFLLLDSLNKDSTQSIGLGELKHDPYAKESVTHECKDVIAENKHEILSLVGWPPFLPHLASPTPMLPFLEECPSPEGWWTHLF
ncbi:hypothetical protein Tco_1426159 [Tanacetum coccineum]